MLRGQTIQPRQITIAGISYVRLVENVLADTFKQSAGKRDGSIRVCRPAFQCALPNLMDVVRVQFRQDIGDGIIGWRSIGAFNRLD